MSTIVNLDINNLSDGFDLSGGVTARKVEFNGADITFNGGGTSTFTFPAATDTLLGRTSTDTVTNKDLTSTTNTFPSFVQDRSAIITVFDIGTNVTTGDDKFQLPIPAEFAGMNLVGVKANVATAGTVSGTTDIQIHNITQVVDMLTTKVTIDSGETSSLTAAVPPVIDTNNDDVASDDVLRIDVDAVSTTPPQGLTVTLTFRLP